MSASIIFINLAGAVALLLWATRMIRTGVERALGNKLRVYLRTAFRNSPLAAFFGFLFAILMQSSTGVVLVITGFVSSGMMTTAIGIAAAAGADLGSALVTRLLRFELGILIPVFLLAGMTIFRMSESHPWRPIARILFGFGLLLMSLQLIGAASEPLRESKILPIVMNYLSGDWITAFVLAAILAWLFHSSVAAILFLATLFDRDLIAPVLLFPLVLGINFGGAMISVILTKGMNRDARMVTVGNLMIRGISAIFILIGLIFFPISFDTVQGLFGTNPGNTVVTAHIVFNGGIAILGIILSGLVARILRRVMTVEHTGNHDFSRQTALDEDDLSSPRLAIANTSREMLVLCDQINLMLNVVIKLLRKRDDEEMRSLVLLDDEVDRVHNQIKAYLARIENLQPDSKENDQVINLMMATIKLEQAADIITSNLVAKIDKKATRSIEFSEQGWQELLALHKEVSTNAKLAFNVLIMHDLEIARQLVSQKEIVRSMEQASEERHIQRLRDGDSRSKSSSSLHIDIVRDFKEINSLLVSIAYPVLESAGMLRSSRLTSQNT